MHLIFTGTALYSSYTVRADQVPTEELRAFSFDGRVGERPMQGGGRGAWAMAMGKMPWAWRVCVWGEASPGLAGGIQLVR